MAIYSDRIYVGPPPKSFVERAKARGEALSPYMSERDSTIHIAHAMYGIMELLEKQAETTPLPEYGTADTPTEAVPYGPDELNLTFRVKSPTALHTSKVFKIIKDMVPYGYEIKNMEHRLQEYSNKDNNYVYVSATAVRLNPVPYGAVDA